MKKRYLILCLLLLLPSFAFKNKIASAAGIPKTEETLLSDWIALQLKLVRTTKGLSQGMLFRYFGYSSVAFYESVVACDKGYQSLGSQLHGLERLPEYKGDKKTCWTASGNAAMAAM